MFQKKQKTKEVYHHGLTTGLGIGLAVGLVAGSLATKWYKDNKVLSADDILEQVKSDFLQDGPIEGSWIHFKKEPLDKFAIKTDVYTGGISRIEEGQLVQYEFTADAHTGSIIDIHKIED